MYYDIYFEMENCTLILNHGQFGGAVNINSASDFGTILNLTNCVFQGNLASKANTYLGADYSQDGSLGGLLYGDKSFYLVNNCIISEGYSTKGYRSIHIFIYLLFDFCSGSYGNSWWAHQIHKFNFLSYFILFLMRYL